MKLNEATLAYQRAQAEFNKAMAYATDATEDKYYAEDKLTEFYATEVAE